MEDCSMGKLDGKIAVITGGNSGIGLATAKRFAAEGAKVVITGRRQAELDKAVADVGHGAIGVQGDVAKLADLDRLYATVKEKHGRVDVLFANAGGGKFAPLGAITEEQFDQEFNTNVKGLLFTVQKALPLFTDGGSIILNASIVSIKGMAAFSVYSATKAAARSFARTWTVDLKDRKIRVNALSPGPILTPGVEGLAKSREELEQIKSSLAGQVPLGRMGEADEIAKVAVFLASDDSSFITGIELFVDGGMAQI
jgi:NAD(P)-dependent dehydrogenase (short-subunit alcohol dehydrogenase family)